MSQENGRIIILDLLRTLAIVMMIIYHTAYDLWALYGWKIDPFNGGWWLLGRITAILFLLLVGITFSVTTAKKTASDVRTKYWKRGACVLGCAILITLATYVYDPQTYVRFGILHCIGVSMLVLPLLNQLRQWNVPLAVLLIGVGLFIGETSSVTSLWLPLGIRQHHFQTLDSFPLLPWLCVILLGVVIGDVVKNSSFNVMLRSPAYGSRRPSLRFRLLTMTAGRLEAWFLEFGILQKLTWPGRHSLLIYMTHQPILIVALKFIIEL